VRPSRRSDGPKGGWRAHAYCGGDSTGAGYPARLARPSAWIQAVEEVGEEYVMQFVSDSAASCKAAGQILQRR